MLVQSDSALTLVSVLRRFFMIVSLGIWERHLLWRAAGDEALGGRRINASRR